jgi:hypothetical protein
VKILDDRTHRLSDARGQDHLPERLVRPLAAQRSNVDDAQFDCLGDGDSGQGNDLRNCCDIDGCCVLLSVK